MVPEKLLFWLGYLLEDQFLTKSLPSPKSIPDRYTKEFYHSNMIRLRRDLMDMTLLMENPIFLTFSKGKAFVKVRLASAFFGKGQFEGQVLNRSGKNYILRQKLIGPYYQPLDEDDIPSHGNGWQVSRIKRDQSEVQQHTTHITVTEKDGNMELRIQIEGTENVPFALEFAFLHDGQLEGVEKIKGVSNAYLVVQGEMMKYTCGKDIINFGPGERKHSWTQLRGALPKLDAQSVYFTGFAPMELTIKIL
jgi:hypothetical protein